MGICFADFVFTQCKMSSIFNE